MGKELEMSAAPEDRDPLEVLADDFMARQRRGERPSISEYVARRPDLAADIEELFPTIAVMERLKVHKEQGSGARASLGGVRLERLGDFRILGEIGRGGMGIVYEAFQESLGRHVAVKVLPAQALLAPQQLQRFQREAQTAAKLHHTNIVPVFGVGEYGGFHYIVMQLIRGEGLDAVLARLRQAAAGGAAGQASANLAAVAPSSGRAGEVARLARGLVEGSCSALSAATGDFPLDHDTQVDSPAGAGGGPSAAGPARSESWQLGPAYWRSVAATGRQVAEALQYAHAHNTLHRDIKPANLLLDAQGVVWITDFGLAKAVEQDHLSQTGAMAGTLRYMAPEQFSGRADARSDIYSLGLTLYEMLTLQPAFENGDRSSLIVKITRAQPPSPRSLNPKIPRDLETIVLKAIAHEPRDRYATAGDLARDLECFLEDRPIQARPFSSLERLWRWARRNRAVAALAASTLVLLAAVAAVASVGYVRTARANADEQTQRKKAEETTSLAVEALDSIFQQFAADRTAPASAALVVDSEQTITLPAQPVLSQEAAAILEQMLAFYDRLAEQGGDDAKLRRKTADANRRVGDIRQRLGHYEQARAAYTHAIELFARLADARADQEDLRSEIARTQNELGNVYSAMQKPEAAQRAHLEALAMLTAAPAESSILPDRQYELARTYYFLGTRPDGLPGPPPPKPAAGAEPRGGPPAGPGGFLFDPRGPRPRGLASTPAPENEDQWRKAITLWQQLVDDDAPWPSPARGPRTVAVAPPGPPLPFPPGDRPGNEDYRQRAVDLLERLVAEHPGVPDYRQLLARCYREAPPSAAGLAPLSQQDPWYKAAQILEKLVKEHPEVADYRYDLSETYAMLADPGPRGPDTPDPAARQRSAAMLAKALAYSEQLVAEHPNIPEYAVSLVNIRLRLIPTLRETDLARAEANLRKALEVQSSLARRFPTNSFYRFWMAVIQESLGGLLLEDGRLSEARSALEDCIASFQEVLRTDANAGHLRGIVAKNYLSLAEVLRRMGQEQAAEEAADHARELRAER
jgi:serine/threonine protein kinase